MVLLIYLVIIVTPPVVLFCFIFNIRTKFWHNVYYDLFKIIAVYGGFYTGCLKTMNKFEVEIYFK